MLQMRQMELIKESVVGRLVGCGSLRLFRTIITVQSAGASRTDIDFTQYGREQIKRTRTRYTRSRTQIRREFQCPIRRITRGESSCITSDNPRRRRSAKEKGGGLRKVKSRNYTGGGSNERKVHSERITRHRTRRIKAVSGRPTKSVKVPLARNKQRCVVPDREVISPLCRVRGPIRGST